MIRKHKKVCTTLIYIEHFLILASTITGCISIFAFASLLGICFALLDKAFFQHDMVYGGFEDLTRRTASDKILLAKAFNIAKHPKYDGYQRGLASMISIFFFFLIKNPL